MKPASHFHANGKLLLSGEYFILDGAIGLALPVVKGQSITVQHNSENIIHWISKDDKGNTWFEAKFGYPPLRITETSDREIAHTTLKILEVIENITGIEGKPNPFKNGGLFIETQLYFPCDWGLGSSSTLISCLSQWANIDPYDLLLNSFGGSGYDIACATNDSPILFQIKKEKREVTPVNFFPSFHENLFFVHLGKKQDSREGIWQYRQQGKPSETLIEEISDITTKMTIAKILKDFEVLIEQHEDIVSDFLGIEKVKDLYFKDYSGAIKSLGAWGGDFILVTGRSLLITKEYFEPKGFSIVIPYKEMVRSWE